MLFRSTFNTTYKQLSFIGNGTFGQVHKIMHIGTKKIYAMKTIKKKICAKSNDIINEIEILKS